MAKASKRSSQLNLPLSIQIPLEDLRFDADNPRIAEVFGRTPTQKQVQELLLGPDIDARELVPSFIENGYLAYEPLIVRPEKKRAHTVLEGNRRLAALLSMRDSDDPDELKAFRDHKLAAIPCMVFAGSRDQELAYLGLRHLSKTKDWSAGAKAAFVERILEEGHTLADAAKITNTQPGSLRQLLLTRRLLERAQDLGLSVPTARAEAEGEGLFWHLGDAVRRTNTKNYLRIVESTNALKQPEIDESKFERLIGWLYGNVKTREQRKIASIRDIPDLDSCLGNPRATNALESGSSLPEALDELLSAGASVSGHLERAKRSVQRATAGVSDVDPGGLEQVSAVRLELARALESFDAAVQR